MSSVEIARQQTVAYNQHGQSAQRDEAFMKFLVEFRRDGSLRRLKGAPLSLFILLGLHEAEILIRDAEPLTVSDMERETGYSRPTVTTALDMLVATNYVQELDERGARNEKQYRVKSYMWFGAHRVNTVSSRESKKFLLSSPAPKKTSRQKIFSPHVHDEMNDDVKLTNHSEETSSIHGAPEIEKILSQAFEGINVQRLAARIDSIEIAKEWVDWCADEKTLEKFRNPQGIAYGKLMAARNARPTFIGRVTERKRARPVISGKLADRATW